MSEAIVELVDTVRLEFACAWYADWTVNPWVFIPLQAIFPPGPASVSRFVFSRQFIEIRTGRHKSGLLHIVAEGEFCPGLSDPFLTSRVRLAGISTRRKSPSRTDDPHRIEERLDAGLVPCQAPAFHQIGMSGRVGRDAAGRFGGQSSDLQKAVDLRRLAFGQCVFEPASRFGQLPALLRHGAGVGLQRLRPGVSPQHRPETLPRPEPLAEERIGARRPVPDLPA